MEDTEFVTVPEFHRRYKGIFSRQAIYRAVRLGYLEHRRIGSKILINVTAFLQGREAQKREPDRNQMSGQGWEAFAEHLARRRWTDWFDLVLEQHGQPSIFIEAKSGGAT